MGIGFTLAGLFLIVTGAQNTYAAAGAQIEKDFTGQANFGYWMVALILVGALGYIPAFKKFSTYFMSLTLLAMFLSKGTGFFSKFSSAVEGAANAPATAVSQSSPSTSSTTSDWSNPVAAGNSLRNLLGSFFSTASPPAISGTATGGIAP